MLSRARSHLSCCAVQAQLQKLTLQITSLRSSQTAREPPDSSVARAVSYLERLSSQNKLPGRFYGRLNSIARVLEPRHLRAVNAALRETCMLVSWRSLRSRGM